MTWSYARCKKVEYILQNTIKPSVTIPAAIVTACCSAIPTSKALSGIVSIIYFNELPVGMAGVIPTIFSLFKASSTKVFPNTS